MLALVKTPHTELSIHGDGVGEVLAWIRERYEVVILEPADTEESVPVEETQFWKEMEANRTGNLLAGARLKAGLTQAALAGQVGIRQNMVSDYERGKRSLSPEMAKRFTKALNINEKHLQ